MRGKLIFLGCALFFVMVGCAPTAHFGVGSKAMTAPAEFEQTEKAIANAELSAGAQYCPEKIAEARELGRKGVETYWACQTAQAMALLARARDLAKDAEACQPPPPPAKVTPPPPPPAPAPPPPPPLPTSLPSGHFEFDKSTLTPETRAELDRIAVFMRNNPEVRVEIQGHTDAVGTETYNQALGERRASEVFDYLTGKGINPNRLKTVSFGETRPAASNATAEGRAQNRRVDLIPIK